MPTTSYNIVILDGNGEMTYLTVEYVKLKANALGLEYASMYPKANVVIYEKNWLTGETQTYKPK